MASFTFIAGEGSTIYNLSGSGLGFYGSDGFGASVSVGDYQGRTFITDSTGANQGPEADNCKYLNAASSILGQVGTGIALTCVPNDRATLRCSFSHSSAVQIQNCRLYIYDRISLSNPASGLTARAFEVIHPDSTQSNNGSGDTTWTTMAGTGSYLSLCPSPGPSGFYAGNGSNSTWASTQHDHYIGLSVSPDSIGSKTQFGLAISVEFL